MRGRTWCWTATRQAETDRRVCQACVEGFHNAQINVRLPAQGDASTKPDQRAQPASSLRRTRWSDRQTSFVLSFARSRGPRKTFRVGKCRHRWSAKAAWRWTPLLIRKDRQPGGEAAGAATDRPARWRQSARPRVGLMEQASTELFEGIRASRAPLSVLARWSRSPGEVSTACWAR